MFKKARILIITAMFCFAAVPCFADTQAYDFYKQVDLTIGDKQAIVNNATVMMDQPAFVSEGRTLVPFRFLGESLGAQVVWDAATSQAKLTLPGVEVAVTVGSLNGVVNGKMVQMDVPAVNKDGRLFIPLRFVSENLGALVNYDSATKSITVSRADKSKWVTYEAPNGLKYDHPVGWVMTPSAEDENIIETKTPNGSTLSTYYQEITPALLLEDIRASYEANGWTVENTFMHDEKDINMGYELLFSYQDKSGQYEYARVLVDPLDTGSNVGEVSATEENDDMDAFILFEIVTS